MAHVMITSRWRGCLVWRHRWLRMRGDDVSMFIRTEKRKNNKNAQRLTSWLRHDDVIITLGRCKFWVLSVRRVWPSHPSRSPTPSSDPICRRSRWKEELEEEIFPRICFFLRKFSPNTFREIFFNFFLHHFLFFFFAVGKISTKGNLFSKIFLFCFIFSWKPFDELLHHIDRSRIRSKRREENQRKILTQHQI